MEWILLWLILFSVLIQGGYFPTAFLLIAVLLAITAFFQKRKLLVDEWILWGFAAVYLFSSLINGYRSDSLAQTCLPCSCALFLYCYCCLPENRKARLLDGVIISSGLFSGAAILAFCGVISLTGAVTAHRLQFTFQYANATGAWFAATSILAQEEKQRHWSLPCIVALLLTRSVGALGTYSLVQLLHIYQRRKESNLWKELLLLHVIAGLFAFLFFFSSTWIVFPLLAILYLTAWNHQKILRLACHFHFHWIVLVAGSCGSIIVLSSQRIAESLLTFTERISQIIDGAAIVVSHPLFGIGAGNWKYLYPYYQSAQYTSTVVHSSIIQIGVDSGLIGVTVIVIFVVLAWRRRKRGRIENLAAVLILLHSLLDFTLQFFPIDAFLLALLFHDVEPPNDQFKGFERLKAICLPLLTGGLCLVMLYSELEIKQMIHFGQGKNWNGTVALYESHRSLFGANTVARECYIRGLAYTGAWLQILKVTSDTKYLSTEELLICAQAMVELGNRDSACELLLSELDKQLYRTILFEQAAQCLTNWEAEPHYITAYNQIVERANNSITSLGKLQGDKKIDCLK